MFDIDFVRAQFPALETPWAFFDNAGGTVVPRQVIQRAQTYMERYQVQLGASYPHSVEAEEQVTAGRQGIADWIGAALEEVVLGPSTTLNLRLLASALRPSWQAGDEIVVTNLDHAANICPWRDLESTGMVIREWPLRPETGLLHWDDLEPLLGERTRLVCFTHCANVVGTVHPVAEWTRRIHDAGAWVCVDGVGLAPHRHVDVRALGVDFYSLSLYKAWGPHQAVLYARNACMEGLQRQNHEFIDTSPGKLQPGGVNHELAASLAGILDYFDAVETHHVETGYFEASTDTSRPAGRTEQIRRLFDLFVDHETRLAQPLFEFLRQHPRTHLLGPLSSSHDGDRVPIVAFSVDGMDASEVPAFLDQRQVAVRFGHFYAPRAIDALGLASRNGIVRVSMSHYNHADEVQRVLDGLDALLG